MVQWDHPPCDHKDCILYKVFLYMLCDLGLFWQGIEHQTFRMRGLVPNPWPPLQSRYFLEYHQSSGILTVALFIYMFWSCVIYRVKLILSQWESTIVH